MSFGFKLEVWGDFALFTRPELSVERFSYSVPTPSAMRGLVESIYWHPGLAVKVDRIHVLNPIRFTSVRRNELKSKASASKMRTALGGKGSLPFVDRKSDIQQRASTVLEDVHYVVEFHFDMTDKAAPGDNPGKFCDIFKRRMKRGQCYSQPYFGCREFPANFREWPDGKEVRGYYSAGGDHAGAQDLGLMLFDIDYSDPENYKPMFFHAVMRDGVLDVAGSEVYR